MNAGTLLFDYHRAIAQADRLEYDAAKIKCAGDDMDCAVAAMANSWRADSATQFRKKSARLVSEMQSTANVLKSLADEIRRTSRRTYEIEMANIAIVKQDKE